MNVPTNCGRIIVSKSTITKSFDWVSFEVIAFECNLEKTSVRQYTLGREIGIQRCERR
jgi:hypothetical protein